MVELSRTPEGWGYVESFNPLAKIICRADMRQFALTANCINTDGNKHNPFNVQSAESNGDHSLCFAALSGVEEYRLKPYLGPMERHANASLHWEISDSEGKA
ncbi:MAG: hypothetical protein IPG64_28045 [Haliea sp.]|nr:hypothetical protein [Haliea sp.]